MNLCYLSSLLSVLFIFSLRRLLDPWPGLCCSALRVIEVCHVWADELALPQWLNINRIPSVPCTTSSVLLVCACVISLQMWISYLVEPIFS